MGFNFNYASRAEIEYVLSLGISPDSIILVNSCKPESDIIFDVKVRVNLTTFNSEEEVYKIRKHHRKCDLLLRIKPMDDSNARCPMRPKYDALLEEVEPLLRTAQDARLTVSVVSFHIGNGDADSKAYLGAIAARREFSQQRLGLSDELCNSPPVNSPKPP
ncbi:Mitochondrial 2-oxoadipate and 2-oxoglutarate transporter [Datura stramonium]|uniref:Mitochondrial 2-oxoadipate and 2-oxoglutarate transporter n=1 Tax=Datura stramonium TaxID=4076 RepID=A0ABS8UW69_DATST|nr:Mitochondrial 2-oxoadipate and 2-oxoglutarate transporter [Datura stramonium]